HLAAPLDLEDGETALSQISTLRTYSSLTTAEISNRLKQGVKKAESLIQLSPEALSAYFKGHTHQSKLTDLSYVQTQQKIDDVTKEQQSKPLQRFISRDKDSSRPRTRGSWRTEAWMENQSNEDLSKQEKVQEEQQLKLEKKQEQLIDATFRKALK